MYNNSYGLNVKNYNTINKLYMYYSSYKKYLVRSDFLSFFVKLSDFKRRYSIAAKLGGIIVEYGALDTYTIPFLLFLALGNILDVSEFKHYWINHSKLFANERNHINGIENFWNQAKRHMRITQ